MTILTETSIKYFGESNIVVIYNMPAWSSPFNWWQHLVDLRTAMFLALRIQRVLSTINIKGECGLKKYTQDSNPIKSE